jgi:hypothetical protein
VDPSGEFIIIDDVIVAVIGGLINLGSNAIQGNIHNFWQGLAAFGAGAVGGIGTLYPQFGGWVWGGATVGATNAWLGGAKSAKEIAIGAGVGIISGVAGGVAGQWAVKTASPLLNSISSPVLRGATAGVIGGAAGGYVGGFTGGLIMTGDLEQANRAGLNGMWMGIGIGGVVGGGYGYKYAIDNHLNPWTGRSTLEPLTPLKPIECRGVKPYNSSYNDPSEIVLTNRLSHYTTNDPSKWTTIGTVPDDPIYLTPNSDLSKLQALNDLALPKAPNFRIDIEGAMLDPNKVILIRRVTGNVYGHGGGGWEIIYRGPINLKGIKVIITPLR